MKKLVTHRLPEKKYPLGSHYGTRFPPLACIASPLDRCQGTVLLSSRQEMGFKFLASSDVCPHGIGLAHRSLWFGADGKEKREEATGVVRLGKLSTAPGHVMRDSTSDYYLHGMNVQVCMPLLPIVTNHHLLGITKSWVS